MDQDRRIAAWLKGNESKGTALLQKLVREPSTRGNELKAQAVIVEKCRELGLEIDLWELSKEEMEGHEAFFSDREDFSDSPNLAAVLKGTGGGKSLILNGHIDVVPSGNKEDWSDDPFSGTIRGRRMYGRGTSDMKGGTVSLLLALEAIIRSGIKLKGDVIFQSVIEEESGGAGTLAAVMRGYRADGAIIPEPTNMKCFPMQQGSMWFRILVTGKAAHGGTRYEGVNAIEKAQDVITAVKKLEKERNAAIVHPLFKGIPIPVPINIGKISAGSWPSSVPDLAVLEGRFGVTPFETLEEARHSLEEVIQLLNKEDDWFRQKPLKLEWFGARWLPGNVDPGHALVQTLGRQYRKVTGEEQLIEASPWATDGGFLTGPGGTPAVVFGPGTTWTAHDADEFIELDNIMETARIIALTAIEWCQTE